MHRAPQIAGRHGPVVELRDFERCLDDIVPEPASAGGPVLQRHNSNAHTKLVAIRSSNLLSRATRMVLLLSDIFCTNKPWAQVPLGYMPFGFLSHVIIVVGFSIPCSSSGIFCFCQLPLSRFHQRKRCFTRVRTSRTCDRKK